MGALSNPVENKVWMTSHAGSRRIVIQSDQSQTFRVAQIHGIAFDKNKRVWHVAAMGSTAQSVFRQCVEKFSFDPEFSAYLESELAHAKAQQAGIRDNTEQPEIRKADSWDHQARAYNFTRSIGDVAMLAMEVGTGKTKVAIDVLNNRVPAGGLVVIACPLNVVPVWPDEFRKWGMPDWRIYALGSDMTGVKKAQQIDDLNKRRDLTTRTAIIINYDAIRGVVVNNALMRISDLSAFVLDEIHKCKTHSSQTSKACYELGKKTKIRLGLTGTILYHSPLDCFAQYRILDEKIFGKFWGRFKTAYAVIDEHSQFSKVIGYKNLEHLRSQLDRIMFEVKRDDVLTLPDAVHVNRYCELEPGAKKAYSDLETKLYTAWEGGELTIANAAVQLLRLQQVVGGTLPNDEGQPQRVSTAKRDLLAEVLDEIEHDEKIVVFAQFTSELADIRAAVEASGRPFFELSGHAKELQAWKDHITSGRGGAVIGMQIQAGSEGISAVEARYCIYYSTGWSLGRYDQSLARVHRPGQERTVTYFHLIANRTIDIKIVNALAARKATISAILGKRVHGENDDD